MEKYYNFEGKVYKVYENSADSFNVREVKTPDSPGGSLVYGTMMVGLIYIAAKMLKLM